MNLKSYNEYLNEDLNGQYNYYGPGSLFPIVQKLKQEGKSARVVYIYLTSLGIDETRKQKVMSQVFMNESIDFEVLKIDTEYLMETSLFEEDKITPDEINDLLNASPDDLSKGIDPKKAKPDTDFKNAINKLKDKPKEPAKEVSGEETTKSTDSDTSTSSAKSNLDALHAVIRDAEKLEKIREILKESRESNPEEN